MAEHRIPAEAYTIAAEDILPGHPDRVCDAVAESLVALACRADSDALVGVEVALHRSMLLITGRVAAHDQHTGAGIRIDHDDLQRLVDSAFRTAGYEGHWAHPVQVHADLDVGDLDDDERSIRKYSDDQGIAVGFATPATSSKLPLEHVLARTCKNALAALRAAHADLLGPDGKVLVSLHQERSGLSFAHLNVAIQHVPGVGFVDLYDLLYPAMRDAVQHCGLVVPERSEWLRLNGIGDFTCGGPMGDNGLSGKKLVVDHYGPQVPIGGGAICGKDAHKPDRVGALRARQVAVRLCEATGQTARVSLGYLPGLATPDRLDALLGDGRLLTTRDIERLVHVPDLSLAGSAQDLELATIPWREAMREGYFGNPHRRWEK